FDVADDRHSGADARAWPRIRRRMPPRRGLFDRRRLPPRRGVFGGPGLLLPRPLPRFRPPGRRGLFPFGWFALEHVPLPFSPAFTGERPKLPSRDRARADAEPFTPPPGGPSG